MLGCLEVIEYSLKERFNVKIFSPGIISGFARCNWCVPIILLSIRYNVIPVIVQYITTSLLLFTNTILRNILPPFSPLSCFLFPIIHSNLQLLPAVPPERDKARRWLDSWYSWRPSLLSPPQVGGICFVLLQAFEPNPCMTAWHCVSLSTLLRWKTSRANSYRVL